MKMTIKQFAEKFDLDYGTANGAVKFLCSLGIIDKVDEIANARGKPSHVYEIPVSAKVVFDEEEYKKSKKLKKI